ncbi:MAG: chorismate mutase, partial [Myxococcota bacterium]|nr:chorismate mutase [Myxococcota bacterium]
MPDRRDEDAASTSEDPAWSADAGAEAADSDELRRGLAALRGKIDAIDREILDQLNQRARLVEEVGHLKSGGERSPIYVASRERDIVASLIESNSGPFPNPGIVHVFREIISATRSLEKMVSVSYL